MSKTMGNQISTDMSANEIVGRVMSISDDLMPEYVRLATNWGDEERLHFIGALASNARHPRDVKMEIARNIAAQFHGTSRAAEAAQEFDRVFRDRGRPHEVRTVKLANSRASVFEVLFACDVVKSKSEARRLIEQGGVRIDGRLVESADECVDMESRAPALLRVGKRRYFELLSNQGPTPHAAG